MEAGEGSPISFFQHQQQQSGNALYLTNLAVLDSFYVELFGLLKTPALNKLYV